MSKDLKISVVIPARLESQRLPRKLLREVEGKALLWYVWEEARRFSGADEVVVLVDSEEVAEEVERWGGEWMMTDPGISSGSMRIASVIERLEGELIINVQGDEPLMEVGVLEDLVKCYRERGGDIVTPVVRVEEVGELTARSVVKVVRTGDGRALYFSRSGVPCCRDLEVGEWLGAGEYWRHIGVYGYRRGVLERYFEMGESKLEEMEKLEQLRFLEAGYRIETFETGYKGMGVDTAEDLERVRGIIRSRNVNRR